MLHAPEFGIAVSNPVLSQQLNAADQFSFAITPEHALFDRVRSGVLSERVTVYRDGRPVSWGRILSVTARPLAASWDVVCEGELGFLNDAVLPEYDFSGSPADYLAMFVEEYAAQCGSDLQAGRVTIEDANDYIVRGNERPSNLLEELLSKTVGSSAGGVLQIRHEGGARFLDWLAEPETSGSQSIAKGSNLLDLSSNTDGAAVVTAIMPLGAGLKDGGFLRLPAGADGQMSGDVYRKGQYLYNKPMMERFGWHAQVMEWPDVTLAANLRRKAIAAVRALSLEPSIEAGAVDLSDAGVDVDAIAIGQLVNVTCNEVDVSMFVTSCEFHLDDPSASSYQFGRLPDISEAEPASDGAGWSGQNDDGNYFWHKTVQNVYQTTEGETTQQIDNSYASPLSKYDLPDDINWNYPTYDEWAGGAHIEGIPLAHVRIERRENINNFEPETHLQLGFGTDGHVVIPEYVLISDGENNPMGIVKAAGYMGAESPALDFNGNIEADGDITAGGEVGDGDGNILSLKVNGATGSVQVPVVANGETPAADRPTVTFPAPIVGRSPAVYFTMGSSPSVWHMRDLHFGANLIGNSSDGYTGFYVRCVNTGSNTGTPWVRWLAVWN